jgi:hypothetical protein
MKRYTVISNRNGQSYCSQISIGKGESLLQALWEEYNIREDDIQFIFKGHPKRISIFTLYEEEER